MSEHFCTYFDHRYAAKGLAMWESLKSHCSPAILHVFCLNDACCEILASLGLPDVHLYSLKELEDADPELGRARSNRSLVEYYFTLTPNLPLHIFKTQPEVPRITYVDADLFFFADPQPVLDEIEDGTIGLIEHRFPDELMDLNTYGRFNVGWLTFIRGPVALACLESWRAQCLEWCYDRIEPGRFAEQKYLDEWPERFPRVRIIQHRGANVAAWNLNRFELSLENGKLRIGGEPLLFFHAHGFQPGSPGRARSSHFDTYGVEETTLLRRMVLDPYESALHEATVRIATPLALALLSDDFRGTTNLLETLKTQISAANADRAAHLEALQATQHQLDVIHQALEASEADRAAKLDVIGNLQTQLEVNGARLGDMELSRWTTPFRSVVHQLGTNPSRHRFDASTNPAFRGGIDVPAARRSTSTYFVVRGWCYHREGAYITGVRMKVGDRMFPGMYGDPRPDVSEAFNAEANSGDSGYEIPLTVASAAANCELQVQLADGSWHVVEPLTMHAPGLWLGRDRLKWGRFWWNAWRGRPRIWASLTESERDFAVAYSRVRGWFNMLLAHQHAPRPLVQERFPARHLPGDRLPRITIVTPSFQQGTFLEQTITSVLDQRDVAVDYVVQDGGSTDNSVPIIRRYAGRLAHWESTADAGQGDAIVRGFSHGNGRPDDLMMYLNSDDILMPGAARFVAEYFAQHPEIDVVYGHRVLIDEQGSEVGRWVTPRPACDDLRLFDFVPQETLFWRRRIWDRVGGIDASFKFALDWDLLLRFRAAGARFARLPWFLAGFRLHALQKTQTRLVSDGLPEMDALRRRTIGRLPTHDELHLATRRAQFDSALVYALLQRGWRT